MKACSVLVLLLSVLFFQTGQCIVEDSNDDLVIALVADEFLKYAEQDHYILDGANFFAQWCNDQGGFQYGNYTRKVTVLHADASISNPSLVASNVIYNSLINASTLVLSPISTPRTHADTLFSGHSKYIFSTVVPTSQIPHYSLSQYVGLAKNYVLFSTSDAVSVSVTTSVQTYMNKSGIPLQFSQQLVINTTDNSGTEALIKAFLQKYLYNVSTDLVVCTFPPDDYSLFASAFETVEPSVKAAAFVLPLTRTVQQENSQGETGDYWVGATQFDPSTHYGISGEYGGTSGEFYSTFKSYYGREPDPYAATAAAALMSYYVAVKNAGTVDTATVKQQMVDMPIFNSFLGNIKYFANGSSEYAQYETFQFKGGVGEFLNDSNSLVYPAPWPWNPVTNPTPVSHFSKPLSIALGVVTGVCICVALAALILLVFKRELFRKQGIVYCGLILIGVLLTYAAALSTLPERTDRLCLAFPWLLGIGFTLVFGCLFIKTWVLLMIFRSVDRLQKKQTLFLTPAYIARLIFGAVLIEVFLIVWTEVDPPKAALKMTIDNHLQLMCTRTNSAFWGVFIAWKGVWLLGGVIVSVLTRNIREDYNESKNIVMSIYNCVIVTIVAVVLAFILHNVPSAIILIQVLAILITFTFSLIVLFSTPWTNLVKSPSTSSLSYKGDSASSTQGATGRETMNTKTSGNSGNSAKSAGQTESAQSQAQV